MCLVERGLQVEEIDHDLKQAKLLRTDVGWITRPRYVQRRGFDLVQVRILLTLAG